MIEPKTTDPTNIKAHSVIANVITVIALAIAVGFNLVFLHPEVTGGVVPFNDSIFHLLLSEMAADAIANGRDVTDPWQRTIGMGFPLFHHYQHFSHIVLGLAGVLFQGIFPLIDMMRWTNYLLLSIFPISIYWSVHHFGFSRLTAGMGALIASLAATQLEVRGFGFDYGSYVFRGWGLYAQLWGMILLPPTLAVSYRALQNGSGYFCATLFLSATLLSHLMYGYMAFVTLGALTVIHVIGVSNPSTFARLLLKMWGRLIVLLSLVVAVTSYFLVPFFMDLQFVDAMTNTQPAITDALGHVQVIKGLIGGDLFDFHRFPSLTVLVIAGFGICLLRWRDKKYLIPVSIFLLGLMLYFGKATWGPLMNLLPLSESLHVYRFIGLVHLGGLCLAAVALATFWQWAISQSKPWGIALAALSTLFLLLPIYIERQSYLSENAQVIEQTRRTINQEEIGLNDLVNALNQLPPGRTYAGEARDDLYNIGYTNLSSFLYSQGIDMAGNPLHEYSLVNTLIPDFSASAPGQHHLFNARYIITPIGNPFPDLAVPIGQFGRYNLFEIPTSGYFDLVDSKLVFEGEKPEFYPAISSWMESDLLKNKRHPIVLLGNPSEKKQDALPLSMAPEIIAELEVMTPTAIGSVISETVYGHSYDAEVFVERDGTLLLKASYHPNLHATVDGVHQETVMLMPGFAGVDLTPGHHNVHIEYRPRTLRKILLGFGLLTLILIFLVEKRGAVAENWFGTVVVPRLSNLTDSKKSGLRNRKRRKRKTN